MSASGIQFVPKKIYLKNKKTKIAQFCVCGVSETSEINIFFNFTRNAGLGS